MIRKSVKRFSERIMPKQSVMSRTASFAWIAKCGLAAVLLLLACWLVAALPGNSLRLPAVTTRDGTLITMNRYLGEPTPDIVLVGSSLTFRLKEEYFASRALRNLALAGGSPLTGLEIVARQPRLPGLILVETNVLSRPVDEALVEQYPGGGRTGPLLIRPVRAAVAAYENWMHAPPSRDDVARTIDRLIELPPGSFDNRAYVERAVQQMNAEDPTRAVASNIERLRQLIPAIERNGTRGCCSNCPTRQRSTARDR
jgi:hypothetical protein